MLALFTLVATRVHAEGRHAADKRLDEREFRVGVVITGAGRILVPGAPLAKM